MDLKLPASFSRLILAFLMGKVSDELRRLVLPSRKQFVVDEVATNVTTLARCASFWISAPQADTARDQCQCS